MDPELDIGYDLGGKKLPMISNTTSEELRVCDGVLRVGTCSGSEVFWCKVKKVV